MWYYNTSLPKSHEEFEAIVTQFLVVAEENEQGDAATESDGMADAVSGAADDEPQQNSLGSDDTAQQLQVEQSGIEEPVGEGMVKAELPGSEEDVDSPSSLPPVMPFEPEPLPGSNMTTYNSALQVLSPVHESVEPDVSHIREASAASLEPHRGKVYSSPNFEVTK